MGRSGRQRSALLWCCVGTMTAMMLGLGACQTGASGGGGSGGPAEATDPRCEELEDQYADLAEAMQTNVATGQAITVQQFCDSLTNELERLQAGCVSEAELEELNTDVATLTTGYENTLAELGCGGQGEGGSPPVDVEPVEATCQELSDQISARAEETGAALAAGDTITRQQWCEILIRRWQQADDGCMSDEQLQELDTDDATLAAGYEATLAEFGCQ